MKPPSFRRYVEMSISKRHVLMTIRVKGLLVNHIHHTHIDLFAHLFVV